MDLTPDAVRAQMTMVMQEMRRAPAVVMDLETAAEEAELAYDTESAKAMLKLDNAEKRLTVEEKKAHVQLVTEEARRAAFIARSKFNRARSKQRLLEAELNGLQSQLRSIDREGA